jgi:hypothetical protein
MRRLKLGHVPPAPGCPYGGRHTGRKTQIQCCCPIWKNLSSEHGCPTMQQVLSILSIIQMKVLLVLGNFRRLLLHILTDHYYERVLISRTISMDGRKHFFVLKTRKHQKTTSTLYLESLRGLRVLHPRFEANPGQTHSMQSKSPPCLMWLVFGNIQNTFTC